ncbi:MAG: hypothetical protein U0807_14985 [Candidatus Binatia bacterium]
MKTKQIAALGVLFTLAFSAGSSTLARADVQVSYTVDETALKTAVAGTTLTFQLYSDSACTMAAGAAVDVAIENVGLVERLKRFSPKGAAKPPKTDRLTTVLAGVTAPGTAFLTVTGTGIAPVGSGCQLQFSSAGTSLPCASQVGNEVYFTGCNVNVRSGSGSTDGLTNGLGNLIVGYNENDSLPIRSGSHNVVVGPDHSYSGYGGLVAGFRNTISGLYCSVTAGRDNKAGGFGASVNGGAKNQAMGEAVSVSGGFNNTAEVFAGSIVGGQCNYVGTGTAPGCTLDSVTPGVAATISGGQLNQATAISASVSGGGGNMATEEEASVSGGSNNLAFGLFASVSGGNGNWASGRSSSVSGGESNNAFDYASVSGGLSNVATASHASITGGQCNYVGIGTAPACTPDSRTGYAASISGGQLNRATANSAAVSGGKSNFASSVASSVAGGQCNTAGSGLAQTCPGSGSAGQFAFVGGGLDNLANGLDAAVSGGDSNVASGPEAVVGGGVFNHATANNATVGGGASITNAVSGTFLP